MIQPADFLRTLLEIASITGAVCWLSFIVSSSARLRLFRKPLVMGIITAFFTMATMYAGASESSYATPQFTPALVGILLLIGVTMWLMLGSHSKKRRRVLFISGIVVSLYLLIATINAMDYFGITFGYFMYESYQIMTAFATLTLIASFVWIAIKAGRLAKLEQKEQ